MLDWMYWTIPSGFFFGGIFAALVVMGLWDRVSPSRKRKGFLPIATTRGDRLFLAIFSAIGIHLVWLALFGNAGLWIPFTGAIGWFGVLGRWG